MLDESKRSLRIRKNPKYLNSDQQDPDKVAFSQLRSHNDSTSINAQKNQDSKTLFKFISYINLKYKMNRAQQQKPISQLIKNQLHIKEKKAQLSTQTNKKTNQSQLKQSKIQIARKIKQSVSSNLASGSISKQKNTISNHLTEQSLKNTEAYIQKMQYLRSLPPDSEQAKKLFNFQASKLQSLYPNITKKIQIDSKSSVSALKKIGQGKKNQIQPNVQQLNYQQPGKKLQKLFKRSSYHVAIAYNIYLKNLKSKNLINQNEIDPTYRARLYKQSM